MGPCFARAKGVARWVWFWVRYWVQYCLRLGGRVAYLLILYQSLCYFFPFLVSFSNGFLAGHNALQVHSDRNSLFEKNIQSIYDNVDRLPTPSLANAGPVLPPPFYVNELRDPSTWYQDLGLKRFDTGTAGIATCVTVDQTRLSSLNGLYRRKRWSERKHSWHHFIYASGQSVHQEGNFSDAWDQAFYDLVQHRNANPSVGSAGFHWLSCPGSFLCRMWLVRGPTLLHFTTDPFRSNVGDGTDAYGQKLSRQWEPVTVRIIEFPLTEQWRSGLPGGVFPSHFNQLRGITEDTLTWWGHPPHIHSRQMGRRSRELQPEWEKQYLWSYGLIVKIDRIVSPWLTVEQSIWPKIVERMGEYSGSWLRLKVYLLTQRYTAWRGKIEQQPSRVIVTVNDSPEVGVFKAQELRNYLDTLEPKREVIIKACPEVREAYERFLKSLDQQTIEDDNTPQIDNE